MPVRPAPPVAAPDTCCAVPEWTGFYVGVHGGGWGHTSFEPSESFSIVGIPILPLVGPGPGVSTSGGVFGFQSGHNWQWGPVVGGLEIDFSGADIKGTDNFSAVPTIAGVPIPGLTANFTRDIKIEELASARGRLGY